MRQYKIYATSFSILMISLIALICVSIILLDFLKTYLHHWNFIAIILVFAIGIAFSFLISTTKVLVRINMDGIRISKVAGILPYPAKNFLFSDILEYTFTEERNFDVLKIKLKNKKMIRILRYNIPINLKDDFKSFVNRFQHEVDRHNDEKKTEIYRNLNFYETKKGISVVYVFGFFIFLAIILLVISPAKGSVKAGLISSIIAAGFYINQYWLNKNKK